jgi:hypothetical protein
MQKNDEFYTQLADIEREMKRHREHFAGKVVYCNCDDPYESNFFKYFALQFEFLGLKKLIATCYVGSPIANKQLVLFDDESAENKTTKSPHKIEITEIPAEMQKAAVGLEAVKLLLASDKNHLTRLNGDGDFRSKECIELLKEADIVVTNPPFSLFREYVSLLIELDKKFLIIGDQNAITYKEIFKYIKENKVWLGYDNGGTKWFQVPDGYDIQTESRKKIENGIKYFSKGSIMWYTNLDHTKRHENLILFRKFKEIEYPKYDNYDAIEVSKVVDIPVDYNGVMGVPITFIDKYNPKQFEILGMSASAGYNAEVVGIAFFGDKDARPLINRKNTYARVFIKKRL